MIEKRADGRGAGLPYLCSKLNDEVGDDPGLVHLPSSVQCSKNCVTHCNSNPVRLFWIKDGDEECKDTPMPGICAIFVAYPSLGLGSSWKQSFTYSSFRPANPPPPVLKLYTSLQHSSVHRVGVARIELSNSFETPSSNSLTIRSSLKPHGFSSNLEQPMV
jgi:hypothetical protein